jgi:hypothetical protein
MAKDETSQPTDATEHPSTVLPSALAQRLTPTQIEQFTASRDRAAQMTQTELSKGLGPDLEKSS